MFKNVLIIGCGLIGSSVLRALYNKKLSKKIYVLEKSKQYISKIRKIKTNCKFIKSLNHEILNFSKLFLIFLLQIKLCFIELRINFLSFNDSIAHN